MTKTSYQDEKLIFEIEFYSDKAKTIAINPSTITFEIKGPDGVTDNTVTPTSNGGTGYWKVQYIVDQYGTWEWRWITDEPRIVAQGEIEVIQRNVD